MRRRTFLPALIFVVLLVAIAALFGARVWREGAMGCARVLEHASYYDPDELEQMGIVEPEPTEHVFTDEAYDMTFPDLYEMPNGAE